MTPEVFSSMFEAGCIGWWTVQDRNTIIFMTSEGGRAYISHYGGIVTDFFEVPSRRNALFMPNTEAVRQQWAMVPPSRPELGPFMRQYEAWWKGEFEGKTFTEAMHELSNRDRVRTRCEERRHDLTYGPIPGITALPSSETYRDDLLHFRPEPRSGVDFEFPDMVGHKVSP